MKIGIFDSGLGGLIILKSIVKKLPQYDYLYLGDTKRVPYGNRSQKTIYQFTKEAVDYLFSKNCGLILLMCNTASARALRKIQKEYLPRNCPSRRVLGVIIPTVEKALEYEKIKKAGVLATQGTVDSMAFVRESKKTNRKIKIFQQPAPLLVPIVENGNVKWARPILKEYLKPLLKKGVGVIILGCTHYPILKSAVRKITGRSVKIISQDEIIPRKLEDYLKRHPEIENKISKNHSVALAVTDITKNFERTAKKWFGKNAKLKLVSYY